MPAGCSSIDSTSKGIVAGHAGRSGRGQQHGAGYPGSARGPHAAGRHRRATDTITSALQHSHDRPGDSHGPRSPASAASATADRRLVLVAGTGTLRDQHPGRSPASARAPRPPARGRLGRDQSPRLRGAAVGGGLPRRAAAPGPRAGLGRQAGRPGSVRRTLPGCPRHSSGWTRGSETQFAPGGRRYWSRTPGSRGSCRCGPRPRARHGVEPSFVTMLRPPPEVVGSKRTYYNACLQDGQGVAAWLNMMLGTERATRGSSRALVRYHDLLRGWEQVVTLDRQGARPRLRWRDIEQRRPGGDRRLRRSRTAPDQPHLGGPGPARPTGRPWHGTPGPRSTARREPRCSGAPRPARRPPRAVRVVLPRVRGGDPVHPDRGPPGGAPSRRGRVPDLGSYGAGRSGRRRRRDGCPDGCADSCPRPSGPGPAGSSAVAGSGEGAAGSAIRRLRP